MMRLRKKLLTTIALAVVISAISGCNMQETVVATPTETPTPTLSSIPTSTASPTSTPTIAPTPRSALSEAMLNPEDLPSGFEPTSLEEFDLLVGDLGTGELTIENAYALVGPEGLPIIIGFTVSLISTDEYASFDGILNQLDINVMGVLNAMGAPDFLEEEELAHLDDIGDASSGIAALADSQENIRIGTVAFRRGGAGAVIYVIYSESIGPNVTAEDLAIVLDARIAELLSLGD